MIIGWIGPMIGSNKHRFQPEYTGFHSRYRRRYRSLNARRPANRRRATRTRAKSTWKGFALGGGIMVLFGAVYVFFPQILLIPYALHANDQDFAETRKTVRRAAEIRGALFVLRRDAIIFGSAIRAAGDTVFSMVITFSCAWVYWSYHYLTWKLYRPDLITSWVWCSLYVIVLGFAFLGRFLGGRWMTMSIIEAHLL